MCFNRQRFVLQSARPFFSTVSIILCRGIKMLCVCFPCKLTLLNSVSSSSSFLLVLQFSFLLNYRQHSLTRFEIALWYNFVSFENDLTSLQFVFAFSIITLFFSPSPANIDISH